MMRGSVAIRFLALVALLSLVGESFAQPLPREILQRQRFFVTDFGAQPDDGKDDTAALNKCMQQVSRKLSSDPTGRGEVVFTPGEYVVTDTILVGSDSVATRCVYLIGGPSYPDSSASTVIIDGSAIVDKPVFNFQGLRHGGARGFLILGPNAKPQANVFPDDYVLDIDGWLTEGVSNKQYSPQCGIAIDAWNGTTPPDSGGYSGVTYSGSRVPPVSTESGHLTFENIVCRGHAVGFMVGPSYTDIRADTLKFEMCTAQFCAYGASSGMRNALVNTWQNFWFDRCHTGFTNNKHGRCTGDMPSFRDGTFNGLQYWFDCAGNTSPACFEKIFSEYCFRVGRYGADMGRSPESPTSGTVISWRQHKPLSFRNCRVRVWPAYPGDESDDPPIKLVTYGPVIFDGCEVETYQGIFNVAGDGEVQFINGTVFGHPTGILADSTPQHFVGWQSNNGFPKVHIERSRSFTAVNDDPSRLTPGFSRETFVDALPSRLSVQPRSKWVHDDATGRSYAVKGAGVASVAAAASSYSHSTPRTLTFTAGAAANFRVGDNLYWQHTLMDDTADDLQPMFIGLRITSISGTTVTCQKLFRDADYDETYEPDSVLIAPRLWASGVIGGPTFDLSSGSASLANPSANYGLVLQAGDFVTGTGVAAGTRIATVPGYLSEHWKRAYSGSVAFPSNGAVITDVGPTDGYDGYGGMLAPTFSGSWRLKNQILEPTGTTPGGVGWTALWDVASTNVQFDVEFNTLSGSASGPYVRWKDANNYYQIGLATSSLSITENASGVLTARGSGSGGFTAAVGDVVRVTTNGTSISAQLMRNGANVGTPQTYNSAINDSAATKIGVRSSGGTVKYGYLRCQPVGTQPDPTLTKNATASNTGVQLKLAELVEVTD